MEKTIRAKFKKGVIEPLEKLELKEKKSGVIKFIDKANRR